MGLNISVVIPLYNKRDTILRALDSVLKQTVLPFEIIVVNDGSTDGSEKIVEQIKNPLIKLVHQSNTGVSAARNKGVEIAKSEWIAFLDADDEWLPTFIKTITELNRVYPQCAILATSYYLQDHLGNRKPILLKKKRIVNHSGILSNYFEIAANSNPPLCSSAIVVNKKVLQSIGGFPVGIKSGEDLLTWARVAIKSEIAYSMIPQSVFIQDTAHTYEDKPNRIPEKIDFVGNELESLAMKFPYIIGLKEYVAGWHKMRASVFFRLGFTYQGLKETLKALRFSPFNYKLWIYLFLAFIPIKYRNTVFKKFTSS